MARAKGKLLLSGCAIAALLFSPCALGGEAVVTGAKSAVGALSRTQVRDLFLGYLSTLPDGSVAVLIDQPESSPLRNDFYLRLTNKTATEAKARWAKLYFTGRGIPPHQGTSNEEIKKFLNATPGAIGYIDPSAVDASVKVILVVN
jgi:ABC-type phosphate transport system substrate-binding protein